MQWSIVEVTAFGFPYDFESIMHYPFDAFAKDGYSWTIRPKPPYRDYEPVLGQRVGLSPIDIGKINAMYGCPERGGAKPTDPRRPPPFNGVRTATDATPVDITAPPKNRKTRRLTTQVIVLTEPPGDDGDDDEVEEMTIPSTTTKKRRRKSNADLILVHLNHCIKFKIATEPPSVLVEVGDDGSGML